MSRDTLHTPFVVHQSERRTLRLTRRSTLALGLSVLLPVSSTHSTAQTTPQAAQWPARPVRVIVPVAAGTATDLTARIYGDFLSPRWGQPIVVENRPGADGLLALGSFVQAADTHTLIFTFSTAVSLNPLIHAKLPYDPVTDLVPLGSTSEVIFGIAAHEAVGAATLDELVAKAKAQSGKINWVAAPGLPRFIFERFRRATGLDMVYVPYQQTGNAVGDLTEGRISVMIAAISTLKPATDSGKVKLLAVTSSDRAPLTPNVPSAAEAGHTSLLVPALGCVFGNKDLSVEQRKKIHDDLLAASSDARVKERLQAIGQAARTLSIADLEALFGKQRAELQPVAEALVGKK